MKTAIFLVGNIRTWELTRDSFIGMFSNLNPDIFISTYRHQYGYHPYIQSRINDGSDILLSNDEIVNMFRGLNCEIAIRDYITDDIKSQFSPNFQNIDNCTGQVFGLATSVHMMEQRENNQFKYDMIIKTRCDLLYNPFEFNLNDKKIIIDAGNVYPNDCIIISTRDNMVEMSKFMMNEIHDPIYSDSHLQPPHKLLECACRHLNLEIESHRIMQGVLRKNGEVHYY